MVKLDTIWTPQGTTYNLGNKYIALAVYVGSGQYEVSFAEDVRPGLEIGMLSYNKRFSNLESAEYFILYAACEYKAMEERGERIVSGKFDDDDDGTPMMFHDDDCPARKGLRCTCGASGKGENA